MRCQLQMGSSRVGLKRRRRSGATVAVVALVSCVALLFNTAFGARESSKGYDGDLTLFSPEGRLYQVEYVMRAVGHYGCPMVGVHGDGCCVVACKRDLPDELVYPDSVSSIFRITDDIYSAATGMPGDVRFQVKRARLQAVEYKRSYGSPMPSRLLTLAMADAAQVNTQHAALRPMACVSLVISVDDPAGPTLSRVEPSGQVFQAWGTAAGRGSATSLEFLEEAYNSARVREENEEVSARGGNNESKPIPQNVGFEDGTEGDDGKENGNEGSGSAGDDPLGENASVGAEGNKPAQQEGGKAAGKQEPPDESSGGLGRRTGFGVVGVEETVELALKALSKASSGKDTLLLTDKNVEIAIASKETGIRICSRKEVKGFLGKMTLSPSCPPKLGQ